jgi:nitrogenase-associated protein
MTTLHFYGKPGCKGNRRQLEQLAALRVPVEVHDLRSEPWTAERLLQFLQPLPVAQWFNPTAPRVASGEIRPQDLGAEEALGFLLSEPLLIRRPLLQRGGRFLVGFDAGQVDALLELPAGSIGSGLEGCACGKHGA